MTMSDNFTWKLNGPLPGIEAHTERKLNVIKQYLDSYFDTVAPDPRMDDLRITFVDGFCGGGVYQKNGEIHFGSPFVLLRAVEEARSRVNIGRRKPLEIKAKFFFSDASSMHMAVLREELSNSKFKDEVDKSIILQTGFFETLLPGIISDIKRRQRQGRSFFVLDQCGYKDVPVRCLRQIFETLDRPEAVLTFSIDALLNFLSEKRRGLDNLRQFGVDNEFVQLWNELKDDKNFGRATAQRIIMEGIHKNSGAPFFTPFMMYSTMDNRWMLLAHLSKHQAARDKMLDVHWDQQNCFRHIGRGSLFELSFDKRLVDSKDAIFSFQNEDKKMLIKELERVLLDMVVVNMVDNSLPINSLLLQIGNRTAAKNEMLFHVLQEFVAEGELEIRDKNGRRKRITTKIEVTDILVRPEQRQIFSRYS